MRYAVLITVRKMPLLRTLPHTRIMKNKAQKVQPVRRPASLLRTVPLRRPTNAERRTREYLTPKEVELLIETAKKGRRRYGLRDATMILVAYRHGLRASELCALRWDQIDFATGKIHIRRLKNGLPSVHLVSGSEMRALRALKREDDTNHFVFMTERRAPMTRAGFLKLVTRLGAAANFPFPIHPHMLRHATGYKLANDGQDTRALQHYLGHKNITHTMRYTQLSSERFKDFWEG